MIVTIKETIDGERIVTYSMVPAHLAPGEDGFSDMMLERALHDTRYGVAPYKPRTIAEVKLPPFHTYDSRATREADETSYQVLRMAPSLCWVCEHDSGDHSLLTMLDEMTFFNTFVPHGSKMRRSVMETLSRGGFVDYAPRDLIRRQTPFSDTPTDEEGMLGALLRKEITGVPAASRRAFSNAQDTLYGHATRVVTIPSIRHIVAGEGNYIVAPVTQAMKVYGIDPFA